MSDHSGPASTSPMAAAKSAAGIADAVRAQADGYIDRRKGEAVGFVADIARSLRAGGGQISDGGQARSFVHMLADTLDDLAAYIDRRGLGELYTDAEAAARRNPMAAVALAAAAGYAAFHVVRSKGSQLR